MVENIQKQYIEEKIDEANLGDLFKITEYRNDGLSISFIAKDEPIVFASINMGIASPGVIYHFTAFPENYADKETNELVRNIINASFQKTSRKS